MKSIAMQVPIVMLLFLLFRAKRLGEKVFQREAKFVRFGCPSVLENQIL